MSDNPFTLRVSDQARELFNELAEEGNFDNKGEFLSCLLTLYQAEVAKKEVSVMKQAIEAAESLTSRMLDALNGTAVNIMIRDEAHQEEMIGQKKSSDEEIASLKKSISSLEEEREADKTNIQALVSAKEADEANKVELLSKIEQLEENLKDKAALIKVLDNTVAEHQAAAAKNKVLTEAVTELKNEKDSLQLQIEKLKLDQKANILDLERTHQNDLTDLQKNYSNDLKEERTKHNAAITDIENRYKNLYALLEAASATPASRAKAKKVTETTESP